MWDLSPRSSQVGDDGFSHVIGPDRCVEAGCCEDAADSLVDHLAGRLESRAAGVLAVLGGDAAVEAQG